MNTPTRADAQRAIPLMAEVLRRDIGKGARCSAPVRRSVAGTLAELQRTDDGRIFASVPTIARMSGVAERTAQRVLAEFDAEGMIDFVGFHRIKNGFTKVWRIDRAALEALPLTCQSRPAGHPTGDRRVTPTGDRGTPRNTPMETHHEEKALSDDKAATDAAAACSPSAIEGEEAALKARYCETFDEWLGNGGLPQAIADICEGFEDVISPDITDHEWRNDLAELLVMGAYDLDNIANATRSFFQTHRRRAQRDARWELLRRPLRHPVVRQRIMAAVEGEFCGDWGAGHRGRRAIRSSGAGPSPGRKHGRSERGTSPAWKNPRNSGPRRAERAAAGANCAGRNVAKIERFDLTPDSPIFEVWGALPAQRAA